MSEDSGSKTFCESRSIESDIEDEDSQPSMSKSRREYQVEDRHTSSSSSVSSLCQRQPQIDKAFHNVSSFSGKSLKILKYSVIH